MDYITMIFDIKGSRYFSNRTEIQMQLIETLRACNKEFEAMIASNFLITIGDEWEGLLYPHTDYSKIIDFFHNALPEEIIFYTGIGIGDITIHNFELTVNQLDGPAFHKARHAIQMAKEKNYQVVLIQ